MIRDKWSTRWADATFEFLQTMCVLTSKDQIIWRFAFNGTDCEHIAVHKGKKLRLNCCDPTNRRFFTDDKEIDIHIYNDVAGELCQEITKQRIRLEIKERAEVMEELNHWLNDEVAAQAS